MRCKAGTWALAALLVFGCGHSDSKGSGKKKDDSEKKDSDSSGGGLGGQLGLMSSLLSARAGEPGPYDEHQKSPHFDESKKHYEVIELRGSVVELPTFSIFGGVGGTSLKKLLDTLHTMAADEHVAGLILRVDDLALGMSEAEELRAALLEFKSGGDHARKLACHGEALAQTTYYVLTACDRIGLAPLGDLSITGPAATPIHLKGLLDKVGLRADFLHIGAYKGAAEPLTRDRPSKEMLETLDAILDTAYQTLVSGIAEGRKLPADRVKELIDTALFSADQAVEAKLVDEVSVYAAFRGHAVGDLPWRVQALSDHEVPHDLSKLLEMVGLVPKERPTEPHVALVYAVGNVIDGEGKGLVGAREEIASRTLSAALRALERDDSVKALVLRIDSGGGSALASEILWNAVTEVKGKKPVVVSMGGVAASGGYYIASGATKIFADRDTLTGSIGVVGGKLVLGGTLAKLGVRAYPMGRGQRSLLWSSLDPWSDEERAAVRALMEATYEQFVRRVAKGRGKSPDDIKAIAQGRVWTGQAALERGLVDAIGGLEDALAAARKLGGVSQGAPLEVYPPEPTLFDLLEGFSQGAVSAGLPFGMQGALGDVGRVLGPEAAGTARSVLTELLRFRAQPVRAVLLFPVLMQ